VSIQQEQELTAASKPARLRRQEQQRHAVVLGRELIGKAEGVLRVLTRCTDASAVDTLADRPQDATRERVDIAALIMDAATGGVPGLDRRGRDCAPGVVGSRYRRPRASGHLVRPQERRLDPSRTRIPGRDAGIPATSKGR
jgi:hypothetical protein